MSVTTPETNSDVTIFYADWCPFCAKRAWPPESRHVGG